MSSSRKARIGVIICLFALGFFAAPQALAQRETLRIRRVNASAVRTPEYQVRGGYSPRVRDWLQVVVEYDVQDEWTDELEFSFYVLLKGRDPRADPFTLLTGDIAYIHIQRDRRLQAVMYVHPSVMARFGALEGVAVEARVDGRRVAVDGHQNWQRWQEWAQQLTPRAGYVMRPDQTPFAVLAADDYEMMRPTGR